MVAERIAQAIALDEAQSQAAGMATRLAAPLVDARVRAGSPGAAEELSWVMAHRMQDGSIAHVKLWDEDGRVVWSDQPELVGRSFDLPDDVDALFGTRRSTAELSDLTRAENVGEQAEGQLLEVYVGTFDHDGVPLVAEAYLTTGPMDANARTILWSFMPVSLGALLLFLLVVAPAGPVDAAPGGARAGRAGER